MALKFYTLILLFFTPYLLQAQEVFFAKSVISSIAPNPKATAKSPYFKTITVAEVANNIGKKVNVCGKVFNAKEFKINEEKLVLLKMGGEYLNERHDVQVRFDELTNLDVDFQKIFLQKNVCINGTVTDAFGATEIYIDTLNARRMVENAERSIPEIDSVKIDGNSLKLLSNAYLLEGPKWKMPIITHLKEGSIIKVEKVQAGWVYAKVIIKNGQVVEDSGIYGFICYQALGLTRKGHIDHTAKFDGK